MAFEVPGVQAKEIIPNRIGLIDADCVAYWAAASCDDLIVDAAYKRCDDRMEAIIDQLQASTCRSYLTGRGNFREDVATYQQYKGNRYDKHGNRIIKQPKYLQQVRQYLIDKYDAILCEGQEADDALAIAQTKCNASRDWHSIISSIDKDLRIVPGLHHDMNSGFIETVETLGYLSVDKKKKVRGAGLKFFYAQLLMGDRADWIPGLPKVTPYMKERFDGIARLGGCGAMAAYHVIAEAESSEDCLRRVLACYASYWDGEHFYEDWRTGEKVVPDPVDALTEQGRLLWMRTEEGEMWEPDKRIVEAWKEERNADG
jgi:hypothetical protein